jgi:acetyl-CoA carboxylase carboxyl transferase subunit alpha
MNLDFEQPIIELEQKLTLMKSQFGVDSQQNPAIAEAIKTLEAEILKLKKETYQNLTRWQKVQLSRHPDRPYTLDYIENICDEFVELHGDRNFSDDLAMVGGLGTVEGKSIMFIGQQKGRNTKQRQMRNFGMANPEGYRKGL